MKPYITAVVSAFGIGTAVGSSVTLLLKHYLGRRSERRLRRIETDRATYQERMTRLIAGNLCAFIRSNRYRDGELAELEELIQNLSDGAHRKRFLDPKVQAAWACLLQVTAQCGWLRLSDVITERDIADYTHTWEAWLVASKESFGPLVESDRPMMRRSRSVADQGDRDDDTLSEAA